MLYSFYQSYISLFENARGLGFLGISSSSALADLAQSQSLAQLFIFSDMLAYVGIVVMVLVIGTNYSAEHRVLTILLVKISGFFCYISLLVNIFGIFSG
jgi:hypothetical protein